ncbi:MAG: EAL domain-containing protein [Caldimicrobium sp.]|nr:EAL domain-containing protein [Caldimicrobium sp.]MDW8094046.1 EAL domain-containing protein [Caldimicrobium sp.]
MSMKDLPLSLIFDENFTVLKHNKNIGEILECDLKQCHLKELLTYESFNNLKKLLLKRPPSYIELTFTTPKGEFLHFRGRIRKFQSSGKNLYLLHGYELSSSKLWEFYVKFLLIINRIIMQAKTEEELYQQICKSLVEDLGFRFVWIGIPDWDSKKVIPKFYYGYESDYLSKTSISLDPNLPECRNLIAKAFREEEISIDLDSRGNLDSVDFRGGNLKGKYLSSVAIPIFVKGCLRAILNINSSEPHFFTEEAEMLFQKLKENIEYALEKIDRDIVYYILNLSIENSDLWLFVLNDQGKILYVNPIVKILTGYEEEEILNRTLDDISVKQQILTPEVLDLLRSGVSHSGVYTLLKKSGENIYLNLKLLPAHLSSDKLHIVAIGRDINLELALTESIEKLHHTDVLTGCYNLKGLSMLINRILPLSKNWALVVVIDIYQFSYINEYYGFDTGDEILRKLATALKDLLRDLSKSEDLLARVSADEFLILIFMEEHEDIPKYLGLLLYRLKKIFASIAKVPLKFNLGMSVYPQDGTNMEELYQKAKVALNFAQKEGPGVTKFYGKTMEIQVQKTLEVESLIEEALSKNYFVFYFQPYFYTTTLNLAGAEALVRIRTPDGRIIPPGMFIEVLEKSPYRRDFEIWAIQTIVQKINHFNFSLGLNLYPETLLDRNFWKEVAPALNELKAPLVLEITERGLMKEPDLALNIISELVTAYPMIKLALDDFGTGYSNMSYLRSFPISYLKIDYSFTKDILQGSKEQGLVKIIIDLGHILSAKVLAEGVETYEQVKVLDIMGCDLVQGFYFDRPLPEEEFIKKYILIN